MVPSFLNIIIVQKNPLLKYDNASSAALDDNATLTKALLVARQSQAY